MINLGSIYLIVKNMDDSIAFYEALLGIPVSAQNLTRWAQFSFGNACIALFNPQFDEARIHTGENITATYNQAYLTYKEQTKIRYGNNFVLNFWVDNLNQEYERIKKLGISKVSDIFFINVASPYYCFMLEDPDGNQIEITGRYAVA